MKEVKLNNGTLMPVNGIGVFLLKPEEAYSSVSFALKNGIRLIDTANAYLNEKAVGKAIKDSGLRREEIYLSTKLWPTVYEDEDAVDKTLERLDTDYIDLLFLHQPAGNWKKGYKLIEKACLEGKVKSIGLSNFPEDLLLETIHNSVIKPSVVQAEAHPYYPQSSLKKILNEHNIKLMAWYPLGHGDRNLLNEDIFAQLSRKYHKTNAQTVLRWHLEKGHIIIPGSKNPVHILENYDIFDFKLSDEEIKEIDKLDKNMRYYNATLEEVQKYASMELNFDGE